MTIKALIIETLSNYGKLNFSPPMSESRSFVDVGCRIIFWFWWNESLAQYKWAHEVLDWSNNWLSQNRLVEIGWSIEFKISGTMNRCQTIFIYSDFFKSSISSFSRFILKKWFCLIIWFLKTWILWTNQFQPNGSDSTSYWINLKLHAPTYIEPIFHFFQIRIWFDNQRRRTNDFLTFDFRH